MKFLLTRLIRGATPASLSSILLMQFLLTRLIRGATLASSSYRSFEKFLLTRLIRGATITMQKNKCYVLNFYSRASYEARHSHSYCTMPTLKISTHAPHTRRDCLPETVFILQHKFLLTRLIRGATYTEHQLLSAALISTHAPHTRRDSNGRYLTAKTFVSFRDNVPGKG